MYWSPSSGTALAEAELEYNDSHVSHAAYVKFRVSKLPPVLQRLNPARTTYALTWTTTPWTLPANQAIAVHPDMSYCVVGYRGEHLILGSARLSETMAVIGADGQEVRILMDGIKGADLAEGLTYTNGFHEGDNEEKLVLPASHVSSETGTGLVHTAPGHGHDDYDLCRRYNIEVSAPVDYLGRFTVEAMPRAPAMLEGKDVLQDGNKAVIDIVRSGDAVHGSPKLLSVSKYKHKYPIDWRTKLPVIIRATAQWFADVEDVKNVALQALKSVTFIPESGRSRLQSFVQGRSQWCISRQRAWGVPIPVLYKDMEGSLVATMTPGSISHIIQKISERGTDAWWTDDDHDASWIAPSLPAGKYIRGKDTMDVWFDSGTTWTQLAGHVNKEGFLADVYLEGSDQHRGWFQSSLLTHISSQFRSDATSNARAPFQRLITHGFILDGRGRKMSKSIGNVVGPSQIMDGTLLPPLKVKKRSKTEVYAPGQPQYDGLGTDALRLWVAKNDYTKDVPVGSKVLQGVNAALHKYRVTLKWLLGVLHDYDLESAAQIAHGRNLDLSNRLALLHLSRAEQSVHAAYTAYEPYRAMRELERYVNVDLSSFFFETAKDIIYTGTHVDRLCAQYVCHQILQGLLVMLAPSNPLLVSEALHYAPTKWRAHLDAEGINPFKRIWQPSIVYEHSGKSELSLDSQNAITEALRRSVNHAQEQLRNAKSIGSSLETCVDIAPFKEGIASQVMNFLEDCSAAGELARALVVSETTFAPRRQWTATTGADERESTINLPHTVSQLVVRVRRSKSAKCPRCWRYVVKNEPHASEDKGEQVCSRCQGALEEGKFG